MIVSPRAEQVIDIVRKEVLRNGDGSVRTTLFVEIDEVYLYRRVGNTYRKVLYWKRGEDSTIALPSFMPGQEMAMQALPIHHHENGCGCGENIGYS